LALAAALAPALAHASEASLILPDLNSVQFVGFGGATLLAVLGVVVCGAGLAFGIAQFNALSNMPVHRSMKEISELIYETCKTYLITQMRFIGILWVFVAAIILVYFKWLAVDHEGHLLSWVKVLTILAFSVVGIAGSCGVAWFGIRVNTFANSRTAFAALRGKPYPTYAIPLQAGMSIGMLLIVVELAIMLFILLGVPRDYAGPCFIGFAIGESLGAAALRIAGGIFTKIADIGADLMKIVFKIKEDDARNPGVIADCTGDNAGDSVGPSADGFETYGVTGVALIVFIMLAVKEPMIQVQLLVWIFLMRLMMVVSSAGSYFINQAVAQGRYATADKMNFEQPLTFLVWLTSLVSIALTFVVSYVLIGGLGDGTLWWKLSAIISCGTLAGAVIPEVVKVFTSTDSAHVREVVTASKEAGASLNIISGLVAGNFSAYWMGMVIMGLMGPRLPREHDGHLRAVHHGPGRRDAGPGVRVRPRGVRLPRHGPGDDRRRLVRPGHRQRAVRLRAVAHRDDPERPAGDQARLRLRAELRQGEGLPRRERRRRQHVQGDGQARVDRERRSSAPRR
jgi:K(+)-stimulated pyrophosphate-energized sodium pump